MNDIGYDTSIKFKGDYAEINIITATQDQLKNLKRHYEMAVDYHIKENNQSQIEFFSEGLKLVNKRIKKLHK